MTDLQQVDAQVDELPIFVTPLHVRTDKMINEAMAVLRKQRFQFINTMNDATLYKFCRAATLVCSASVIFYTNIFSFYIVMPNSLRDPSVMI